MPTIGISSPVADEILGYGPGLRRARCCAGVQFCDNFWNAGREMRVSVEPQSKSVNIITWPSSWMCILGKDLRCSGVICSGPMYDVGIVVLGPNWWTTSKLEGPLLRFLNRHIRPRRRTGRRTLRAILQDLQGR